jgi:hypothetical protein
MTKLIKASTALKRAQAVDVAGEELARVADTINRLAAAGQTRAYVFLSDENKDFVIEKLLDAGYVLEYGELMEFVDEVVEDTRNFLHRVIDFLTGRGRTLPDYAYSRLVGTGEPNRREVLVSWAPVPEAEDEEADDLV